MADSLGTSHLNLRVIPTDLNSFTSAIDQCEARLALALLRAFAFTISALISGLATRACDLDLFLGSANLDRLTMVSYDRESLFTDTHLLATLIAIGSTTRALVTLHLLYLIVPTFLDGLTFVVDECGSGLADANLSAAVLAVLVMSGTVSTFRLWDLIMGALENRFTEATNTGVSILASTCRLAVMLETSAS